MIENENVFIKNIYYMLSYAFTSLRKLDDKKVSVEAFSNIHNLFAEILAKGISVILKQGLYKEYVAYNDNLQVVRGKINLQETMKNRMARKVRVSCEFDELSENNIFNQILKMTVMLLLKNPEVDSEHKNILKKRIIFFSNVDEITPGSVCWNTLKFQRNNQMYRTLLGICRLILDGMLLTNDQGENQLAEFMDETQMCRLYEKFILEYYRKHYPQLKPKAAPISWALDDDMDDMLPIMKTDITLQLDNKVLIIDAKYYTHVMGKSQYESKAMRSNNLYQIFTYVKNKDYEFGDKEHEVSGMLLYAKTKDEDEMNYEYKMHSNTISVRMLNLEKDFTEISKELNGIVERYFGEIERRE